MPDATKTHNGDSELLATPPDVAEPDLLEDDDDDLLLDDDDFAPEEDDRVSPTVLAEDDATDGLFDDDPLAREMDERLTALETTAPDPPPAAADDVTLRLQRLERAAQALADAELQREGKRVRRKVSAASLGAGAAAAIPVLLQLAGAYDLPPELAATMSAVAGFIGAFAAGWTTPERKPTLPAQAVLGLVQSGSEEP